MPIFINGVEAHTIVRDLLTTEHEQRRRAAGFAEVDSLEPDAAVVDAVVSTVGFPLVGGPAGSMEAGRQAEVAQAILRAKNVPYVVAAPLLIQDVDSWTESGIGGLQSVILYALPELDGAVDTVPLGGLVKDDIYLTKERVYALADRLKKWHALRRKKSDRKLAVMLYGFPRASAPPARRRCSTSRSRSRACWSDCATRATTWGWRAMRPCRTARR